MKSEKLRSDFREKLLGRFLKYVGFDTQSNPASETYPSTEGQLVLLRELADEMRAMGVADVTMDTNGYVTGTVPATQGFEDEPVIGFFAHVDTSPDVSGAGVKPIIEGDIVRSDGTTLLGADDKAGVAEIMTAVEILLTGDVEHGTIKIAFTPDEEIGCGVDHFDVAAFGADFAYTVDGGALGELEYENFNAAGVKITITGRNIHPGSAKGEMVNALYIAAAIATELPADQRPENTEGYEGFFHLVRIVGTVDSASMEYIVRDHDRAKFEARKRLLTDIVARHPQARVEIRDSYFNMREVLEQHPQVVERARRAMESVGVEPIVKPIRGGTDGARLSFMGLPCPNIFTGGGNFHSRDEYASVCAMVKATLLIVAIAEVKGR